MPTADPADLLPVVPADRPVPTVSVTVFFPARPEHFAYPLTARLSGPELRTGRYVTLSDVKTISLREEHAWFFAAGGRMVREDGTLYTDQELDRRRWDAADADEKLRPYGRRLSFI